MPGTDVFIVTSQEKPLWRSRYRWKIIIMVFKEIDDMDLFNMAQDRILWPPL
jgi:hypothetical protein